MLKSLSPGNVLTIAQIWKTQRTKYENTLDSVSCVLYISSSSCPFHPCSLQSIRHPAPRAVHTQARSSRVYAAPDQRWNMTGHNRPDRRRFPTKHQRGQAPAIGFKPCQVVFGIGGRATGWFNPGPARLISLLHNRPAVGTLGSPPSLSEEKMTTRHKSHYLYPVA